MLQIERVDPSTVAAALGLELSMPAVAVVGRDRGVFVGSGGLAWGMGRAWLWFNMVKSSPCYALPIVRETKRMLRRSVQLGEREVFAPRDDEQPNSERLLRLAGFEPTEEKVAANGRDFDVWRWGYNG